MKNSEEKLFPAPVKYVAVRRTSVPSPTSVAAGMLVPVPTTWTEVSVGMLFPPPHKQSRNIFNIKFFSHGLSFTTTPSSKICTLYIPLTVDPIFKSLLINFVVSRFSNAVIYITVNYRGYAGRFYNISAGYHR